MTWTGPLPPPFDVMFDSVGEHQQFTASIFNLDANGNIISFNPGIYGGFPDDGLEIATPEPATITLLLLALLLLAIARLIR